MKKLIRDLIKPDIGTIYTATDEEYREALYDKLLEEANELFNDRNIEEAADVLEVLLTIVDLEGWLVYTEAQNKRNIKGSFNKKHIWENTCAL